MPMLKRLLLLSSSKVADTGFLEHALSLIEQFVADNLLTDALSTDAPPTDKQTVETKKLLFIPYAGISIGFDQYESMLKDALKKINVEIQSIHHAQDPIQAISQAQGIITGGGNTFSLLNTLHKQQLIEPIRQAVQQGIPYIGWSAGSNIAAPTIRTTNDMPIVEPPSFNALNLLPWQINPHYIDGNPPGHNGETRQQRIEEFLIENPAQKVIGIPEGTALKLQNEQLHYIGNTEGFIFKKGSKTVFNSESDLNQLLA